jgi:hypothetical protein
MDNTYRFKVIFTEDIFKINIVYRDDEYSFDVEPWISSDLTLVVDEYIQLDFHSYDMMAREAHGLCPHTSWILKRLNVPTYRRGQLLSLNNLEPGVGAFQIKGTENWESKFDLITGWFCIGDENTTSNDISVEFAIDVVAVIDKDEHLKALWWKPKFRPEFNLPAAFNNN